MKRRTSLIPRSIKVLFTLSIKFRSTRNRSVWIYEFETYRLFMGSYPVIKGKGRGINWKRIRGILFRRFIKVVTTRRCYVCKTICRFVEH